jgi:hypothetical protein
MADGHHGRWGRVTAGKLREEGAWRLLTPKIGTGERLICGPNLVTNPVQRRKISSEDSAEMLAVGSLFLFGKGLLH